MNASRRLNVSLASAAVLMTAAFTPASANDTLPQPEPVAIEAHAADLQLPKPSPAVVRRSVVAPPAVVRRSVPTPVPAQVTRPARPVVVTMLMLGVGY